MSTDSIASPQWFPSCCSSNTSPRPLSGRSALSKANQWIDYRGERGAHSRRSITSGGEISGGAGRRMSKRARDDRVTEELAPLTLASLGSRRANNARRPRTYARARTHWDWRRRDATLAEQMRGEVEARSETLECIAKRARRGKESQFLRVSLCAHHNREESGCKMSRSRRPRFQVLATD